MTIRSLVLCKCFAVLLCHHVLIPLQVQAQNMDSLENVLQTQELPPAEQLRIYDKLSWGYLGISPERAVEFARNGVTLSLVEKDKQMAATLYRNLGVAYYMWNKHDTAATYLEQALGLALEVRDKNMESRIYIAFGNLYNVTGRYQEAISSHLKALPYMEQSGNRLGVGVVYSNIAGIYHKMHNLQQAKKYFSLAEDIAREIDDREGVASILIFKSEMAREEGNHERAVDHAKQAAAIYHKMGNRQQAECIALMTVATACYDHDDFRSAMEYAREALALAEAGDLAHARANERETPSK